MMAGIGLDAANPLAGAYRDGRRTDFNGRETHAKKGGEIL